MKQNIQILLGLFLLTIPSLSFSKAIGEFPASITELSIESHGDRMSGLIYQAKGSGPHPTILLLHGYPGNEKNLDVAQAMRRKGWNVAFFHYRGSWGSEGEFSYRGAEADVQVVLDYLRNNAATLRVNPQKISTVGHSMGGHMAIAGLLDDPSVVCSIAYDGANMGAKGNGLFSDPETSKMWLDYSDTLFMLKGWSGQKALNEIKTHGTELDLVKRAKNIDQRPVLLLAANTKVIPLEQHILPLFKALQENGSTKSEYILIEDDHSFSSSRPELIENTATFLEKYCR